MPSRPTPDVGLTAPISAPPTLAQALVVWLKIGVLSFGGPAGQIALMHQQVIEQRKWLTESDFLRALSFCMVLPGPEAMQLATYIGWRLHGVMGGLMAGLLFIIPGALVILLLASGYVIYGEVPWVMAAFVGIKAAIVVIVVQALVRMARRSLSGWLAWLLACGGFVGIFFFSLPFPLLVIIALIIGLVRPISLASSVLSPGRSIAQSPTRTLVTAIIWLGLWWGPLALLILAPQPVLWEIGVFFSQLAVVTFGGAYAVLTYLAQAAVFEYGWVSASAMMDGLGLAETTPGPLILVTQFIGFLAAHQVGGFDLALLASAVVLWATFMPCFLWIFVGAPYIDWLTAKPRLKAGFDAIMAVVIGAMSNLMVWFALHTFFQQTRAINWGPVQLWQVDQFNGIAVMITLLVVWLLFYRGWGVMRILLIASVLAVLAYEPMVRGHVLSFIGA
ncbi:MAG: chromate efflux transporter [Pseudomonadota bacterium]